MGNTYRYHTSLEHVPSFVRQSEPDFPYQDSGTGHNGYLASSPAPWLSSPFKCPAIGQDHLGFDGDEELELDAFDKELLAAEHERPLERQWQASPDLTRVPLPSRTSATPVHSRPRELREDLFRTPVRGPGASSSSVGLASSPTLHVAKQRQEQQSLDHNRTAPVETLVLPNPAHQPHTRLRVGHTPPIVHGIRLVPAADLPDLFHSLFPFPIFNAVQSKSYPIAFNSDDNMVLSAPTGSGKTVVMELAICRLIASRSKEQYKVVYQAPTKSLCSERFRDWQAKFSNLDLQCIELTGDTEYNQLRNVQSADIIITTPEKWDSVTRKWNDHSKLMQLVKLFLIDEVHVLKDSRGATLEAVVSRMKSVGSDVRFIALSATVPNSEDIATWLGKSPTAQHLPAHREVFGEGYRPVQLRKFVYGYGVKQNNNFVFDSVLTYKLPEIIAKHSNRKPIMIFCFTRSSAIQTSKSLAALWTTTNAEERLWPSPKSRVPVTESDLRQTTSAGIAFHHAGLSLADRRAVEDGFLDGNINIICSTSTLAVGVNLPCYLVIIKGTVGWTENGVQEYADLEVMQMLGRAGRSQFESSACAVILTRDEKIKQYQDMVSGKELLESSLHVNLIDHLNAEIGLGTVSDIPSAKKWLGGTFLFVRLRKNPNHYKLKENNSSECRDEDELLEQICRKDLKLLQDVDLVSREDKLKCTEFGDAMARYCIKFETMKIILSLPPRAKMSEILLVLAQADEFHDIRMKAGEKSLFKEMNKNVGIKFPIKVDVALPAHKVSLLIQTELGGVEFPSTDTYRKHKQQYQQDKAIIFQHVNRLIRCIIDCQLYLQDSVSARHALELGRSVAARVWDDSPLQLKQLEHIGNIAVRKLAGAGINSMEILENTEPHRIEAVLQKNPPFGMKLLSKLGDFPKLRVSVKQIEKESKVGAYVKVKLRAVIGFVNDNVPIYFHKKPIYICFMAETSDGKIIDFRRMQAKQIQTEHEILLMANLSRPTAHVACHVMCDEVAGTNRRAEAKLEHLPIRLFPTTQKLSRDGKRATKTTMGPLVGILKAAGQILEDADDFGVSSLKDSDLLAVETLKGVEVMDIDNLFDEDGVMTGTERFRTKSTGICQKSPDQLHDRIVDEPQNLGNGKWACNHTCRKDSKKCKHKCCNEGLERPRKPTRQKMIQVFEENSNSADNAASTQKKHRILFKATQSASEETGYQQQKPSAQEAWKFRNLNQVTRISNSSAFFSKEKLGDKNKKLDSVWKQCSAANLDGLSGLYKTEYLDELEFEDLPMPKDLSVDRSNTSRLGNSLTEGNEVRLDTVDEDLAIDENDLFNLEAGMIGLEDSMTLVTGNDDSILGLGDRDNFRDTQSSCKTLDNFSPSKPLRPVASGILTVEDDMGSVDTPLTHNEPQSLRKRSSNDNDLPPDIPTTLKRPAETGVSIKAESSSPLKYMPSSTDDGQREKQSTTGMFVNEQKLDVPGAKRMKLEVETVDRKRLPFILVRDVPKTYGRLEGIPSNMSVRCASGVERGLGKETEESYEERQKRLWSDVDPAIYEEFHDIVEVVED